MAQLLFDYEDLENFYSYREKRLSKVPLDQLLIEPIRKPTPSVIIEGDSKENSKTDSREESQEKSSQNGKSRSRELEKDTTQSTEKIVEQTSTSKQNEIHATSTPRIKPLVIDLEEEWDNFNKILSTEEQTLELQTPQ